MKRATFLAYAMLIVACARVEAGTSTAICDIEVEPNLKNYFYVVTVNGKAYKGKRYIDYGDAVQLRDVLIQTGMCWRPATLRKCEVRPLATGRFTVDRAGKTFDPTAIFVSPARARKRAQKLAAAHLCYLAK